MSNTDGKSRAVIEKARVRRCVGNPPRQTEDPQSPPCVNYWEGNNGGSTYKGVTRDEIRVALFAETSDGQPDTDHQKLVEHFNSRYEFYGRRIRPILIGSEAFLGRRDPAQQRALATKIDEEFDALALAGQVPTTDNRSLYGELARRQVISVDPIGGFRSQAELRLNRPYQWTYGPTEDQQLRNSAEWMCKSLAGRTARHAGVAMSNSRRSFGIFRVEFREGGPDVSDLSDALRDCSGSVLVENIPPASDNQYNAYTVAVGKFRAEGITTIACVCSQGEFLTVQNDAQEIQYEPEWVIPGNIQITDFANPLHPLIDSQNAHTFGMTGSNKPLPLSETPWHRAYKEVSPDSNPETGRPYVSERDKNAQVYHSLLALASGIQSAGPNLTPQSFERGLLGLRFSNPASGLAPYWQARVGFSSGARTMVQDFALVYWTAGSPDPNDPSEQESTNGFCYLNRGARWSLGNWPEGELPFFDRTRPCR